MRRMNRCALVVRPLQPFMDWVRKVDREYAEGMSDEAIGACEQVFLTPLFFVREDTEEYLEQNATWVFEVMLNVWCDDPKRWPKKRDWETFQAWLDYEVASDLLDMPETPLRSGERSSYGGKAPQFGFWESVLNDFEDQVHHVRSQVWADGLFREFEASPEAKALEGGVGGARLVVDELHVYGDMPFQEIDAELLEDAMFRALKPSCFEIHLEGASVVAELGALFAYVKRVYDFAPADACLELLGREGLAEELDVAMHDMPKKKEAELEAGRALVAGGFSAAIQTPFVVQDPDVGRNEPCGCGSGKKYKRCCLKVS